MQFSSLGFMYSDNTLAFPSEIIRPIGIGKDKMVYCMYYPVKYSIANDSPGSNRSGFMMTPIAHVDWLRTARFTIKIKDIPGAANAVCDAIQSKVGSIGFIRGGLTGYSYFTLNITVSFEDLDLSLESEFDEDNGYYYKTNSKTKELTDYIMESCREFLYYADEEIVLNDGTKISKRNCQHNVPIVTNVCTSLTYFWRLSKITKDADIDHFKLKFGTNNRLVDDDHHIRARVVRDLKDNTVSIGSRPIYASVDTKDQIVRFQVLSGDSQSSIVIIHIDWETVDSNSSRGFLEKITAFCAKNKWNIIQVHSKESKLTKYAYGRLNLLVDMGSKSTADRYLDARHENNIDEFQNKLSARFRVVRVRVLPLTKSLAADWKKPGVEMERNRVRFLVSASKNQYENARKLCRELNGFGYVAQFIHDELESQTSGGDTPIKKMADIIRSGSVLLVIIDQNYGRFIKIETGSGSEFHKEGLFSEYEVAMALGAGVDVIPVVYECGNDIPEIPAESLISKQTTMIKNLDFTNDKEKSLKQIEDVYLGYAGMID